MKYESQINSLFNKIDDDYLIDLICEFSRIKSVWDPKNGFSELEAALWIEQKFKEFGFKTDLTKPIEYLLKSQIVFLLGKDQIFNDSQISQLLSKK